MVGVKGGYYHPCADDIGANICIQVQWAKNASIFKLSQIGPLEIGINVKSRSYNHK